MVKSDFIFILQTFEAQYRRHESARSSQSERHAMSTFRKIDIYAGEGLSATSYNRRTEFLRMLEDCKTGKIDLIITKNVARFSRNVVDCLDVARKLLNAKHRVGIFFQEQNINTLWHPRFFRKL